MKKLTYRSTVVACYMGLFLQAIVINLTPIIFIPLREQFGLSYWQFGFLVLVNFVTQVVFDIVFIKPVEKLGFRPFVVGACMMCAVGFLLFASAQFMAINAVFVVIVIATMFFSGAGGILEITLSAIINSIPTQEKDKAMAMLHSFYAWGQVSVVAITTALIFLGIHWAFIVVMWTVVPVINMLLFMRVPLSQNHHEDEKKPMKVNKMIFKPIFIIAFICMVFGGATEVGMSQWASTFMEKGLGLPKVYGDMLGMCGFGVMLGIGRSVYGKYGHKLDLGKVLIYGSLFAAVCYIIVAVSNIHAFSIVACAITGLCVSLLWPGTLVETAEKIPFAGVSVFALLAAGGDIGASVGPWLTGVVTDVTIGLAPQNFVVSAEQLGLRVGMLVAVIFPAMSAVFQIRLRKMRKSELEMLEADI